MAKTELTKEIEQALVNRARRECKRYGLEVPVPKGICDFVTVKMDYCNNYLPIVTMYEIKVSFSDYWHSDNGANFLGDYNYYVMPQELLDEIIEKGKNQKLQRAGLIVYKNGKLYKKTDGRGYRCTLSIDQKLSIVDSMLRLALKYNDVLDG